MRTQTEWEKRNRLVKGAKALADFARLEPDGIESFREDHPDFVPAVWWSESNWLRERNLLLKAWRIGFPADLTLKLTTSRLFGVADRLESAGIPLDIPNPSLTDHLLTNALDSFEGRARMGLPPNPKILGSDGTDITAKVKRKVESSPQIWPYQRAVLFLHIHPKQARICVLCKKTFVSESPNAQWCRYSIEAEDGWDTTCYGIHRKEYKDENWSDNKNSTNERRRREYAAKAKAKTKTRR